MAINRLNMAPKAEGDDLTHGEWNSAVSKIDELVGAANSLESGLSGQSDSVSALAEALGDKVGDVTYEGGSLVLWDEPGGRRLSVVSLSGTVYQVSLEGGPGSVFYVLTSETSHFLSVRPVSRSGVMGGELSPFAEDYSWHLSVDSGSGSFASLRSGVCASGAEIRVDIRGALSVGSNRVRLSVTGDESGQVRTQIWTVNVTTLTLESHFSWWRALTETGHASIDGLFLGGNMQKTLHVMWDGDEGQHYTESFSANAQYSTSAYSFPLEGRLPATTGVHDLEIWLSGDGVETRHWEYRAMCVLSGDEASAQLVCMNSVAAEVANYDEGTLFEIATYNVTSVGVAARMMLGSEVVAEVADERLAVESQTRHPYIQHLEVDTEEASGLWLDVWAGLGSESWSASGERGRIGVDNTNSYAAAPGALFCMHASQRSNSAGELDQLYNTGASGQSKYAVAWEGMSWSGDGYVVDGDGVKCLMVGAGSRGVATGLRPLASAQTGSVSIELKVRVDNVSDYDTPILSFMSTEEYVAGATTGVMLFPTKLLVLSTSEREVERQSVNLGEGRVLHLVVVLQRGYSQTGRNLCRLYVNGRQNAVFEYSGDASFGNGCLRMGQGGSDLRLYSLRTYGRALERLDVVQNLLNTLSDTARQSRADVRAANAIVDGGRLSYELCRQRGYNCMVIETQGDVSLPSVDHTTGSKTTLRLEYGDHPEWNVRVENAPVDGQGTTSMRYYRWNLRWKMKKDCVWTYADGSTETGKGGYIAGREHPKCEKVTAKKNYASSPQGHKMGATAMYDELYEVLGLKSASLPLATSRVAVYQEPMMGFHLRQDGSYEFIGLYTIGPDKGDKGTFGYDTSEWPDLLSLEGPNHAPLGTRFLHPWTEDVAYDPLQETLTFGGEEGWDVDVCAYETDGTSDDWSAENEGLILGLLEREWKPAYDLVYYCSPFLRSLQELGLTLESLNSQAETFRNGMDILGSLKNEVLQFYDESYRIVYWRTKTRRYEVLAGHDLLEYLGDYLQSASPTREEIVSARKAKFRSEAGLYWNVDDLCYHDCYCELVGASDNHAKNSYPFKFRRLSDGGRWSWRQDDLDTILATDNNGNNTKSYSIEVGDVTGDGTGVFQGSASSLWALVGEVLVGEKRSMMSRMLSSLVSLSQSLGVGGANVHESVMNMFEHYFWKKSSMYFPATAYNEDAEWSYVTPWAADASRTYNNVYPLTQALGDQLESERLWVERRLAYLCSLYQIGGFSGSGDDGYGRLEFTPAETFTFSLTPAIDLYPSGNRGGGDNIKGGRTRAGALCQLTATSDGSTTFYLKAVDWLTDLGDLSGLVLTTRGGDTSSGASFSVSGKRLRRLKVGDASGSLVRFNAASLAVSGAAVEEVDARNVSTLRGIVSLQGCPRLRRALFVGTNVATLLVPAGAKVTEVSFPSGLQTLFLHTLPMLTEAGLAIPEEALSHITGIYYNSCRQLSPLAILRRVLLSAGSRLQFVTMVWSSAVSGTSDDLDLLATLAGQPYDSATGVGFGRVDYDTGSGLLSNSSQRPVLEGTINIAGSVYEDSVARLQDYFGAQLALNVTGQFYVRFADEAVSRICATNWGDGTGTTVGQVSGVKVVGGEFRGNTSIVSFEEFEKFTGLEQRGTETYNGTTLIGVSLQEAFSGCTSLERVALPPVTFLYGNINRQYGSHTPFYNCQALKHVDWGQARPLYTHGLFQRCSSLEYYDGILPEGLSEIGSGMFFFCSSLTRMVFYEGLQTFGDSLFQNCFQLRYVEYPSTAKTVSLVSLTRDAYTGGIYIVVKATMPPACDTGGYNRTMYFYVPDESVGAYKSAQGWSTYASSIKALSELPAEYRAMGTV